MILCELNLNNCMNFICEIWIEFSDFMSKLLLVKWRLLRYVKLLVRFVFDWLFMSRVVRWWRVMFEF